jgi:hypothetical protein
MNFAKREMRLKKMNNDQDNTYSVLIDKGAVIEASYSAPELPKFGGNPLLETLPLANTQKQAAKLMQRFPDYSDEMRQLPTHLRTHAAMDILHFIQPVPNHLKLEGMISRVIRDGYLSRNPMDPSYAGTLEERLQCFKNQQKVTTYFAPTAAGFSILGMSGVGKSTALRSVLHLYPQIILHKHYKGRNFTKAQIVWLTLQCPKDGSTRGLCLNFFEALDALLGTNYKKDFDKRWRSTNEMSLAMANIAARHHVGLLGIDEIQHLNAAKSGGADEMLNFFVSLINNIGLPVILIGTYEAASLLGGTFRQARRGSGQGDLMWNWMEYDEEWRFFVETLWRLQYVKKKCPLTPGLSSTLHEVSYGVIDLAIRIYLAAQIRAMETRAEVITEGLLRSAYRDDFKLLSRIVEVLRSGDSAAIAKIGDVCPPPTVPIHEVAVASEQSTSEQDLASDAQMDLAQISSSRETEGHKGSKKDENAEIIRDFFDQGKGRRAKGKHGAATTFEHGDLRGIVTQGAQSKPPVSPYQSLLEAGVIKSSGEFLS